MDTGQRKEETMDGWIAKRGGGESLATSAPKPHSLVHLVLPNRTPLFLWRVWNAHKCSKPALKEKDKCFKRGSCRCHHNHRNTAWRKKQHRCLHHHTHNCLCLCVYAPHPMLCYAIDYSPFSFGILFVCHTQNTDTRVVVVIDYSVVSK